MFSKNHDRLLELLASAKVTLPELCRYPLMRQQFPDLTRSLRRQPCQHIFQIGIRIMPIHARRLDQAHDRRRPFSAA